MSSASIDAHLHSPHPPNRRCSVRRHAHTKYTAVYGILSTKSLLIRSTNFLSLKSFYNFFAYVRNKFLLSSFQLSNLYNAVYFN